MAFERLSAAFVSALGLSPDVDVTALEYRSIPEWDSLAHLTLVMSVETAFDVMLDVDDVLGLRSYDACVEILERHGISFDE